MLTINDISVRLGGRTILDRASAALPPGARVGLIGRNGAGKSTLLALLAGLDYPDRGEVITDQSISWPVGLGSGFQGSLSARDNVRFVCRVFGATGPEKREKIEYVERFAEIGAYFVVPYVANSNAFTNTTTGATTQFPLTLEYGVRASLGYIFHNTWGGRINYAYINGYSDVSTSNAVAGTVITTTGPGPLAITGPTAALTGGIGSWLIVGIAVGMAVAQLFHRRAPNYQ